MTTRSRARSLLLPLLLLPTALFARTWYVLPDSTGDAPTIQAAIDSSAAGDTVLVAAGLYYVNLRINAKSGLSLVSESGPEVTILDGTYANPGEFYRKLVVDILQSSDVLVEGFTIQNGHPPKLHTRNGAGLRMIGSRVMARGNIIRSNMNEKGAGIYMQGDSTSGGTVIEGNQIVENTSAHSPGGWVSWTEGPIYIRNNVFSGNEGYYAGLYTHGGEPWLFVEGNTFRGNISQSYTFYNDWGDCLGTENFITDNVGSGIAFRGGSMEHNTVVGNSKYGITAIDCSGARYNVCVANVLGGIGAFACSSVDYNDSWGNGGSDYDFYGTHDTTGNISEDPLFCDPAAGDYSLASESPCAPENSGCGLIGAFPVGCVFTGVAEGGGVPRAFCLSTNWPNPFNPSTSIRFALPERAEVDVTVYDASGRRVAGIASGVYEPGEHAVAWDGRNEAGREVPSGAYFVRLQAEEYRAVRKVILIR